MHKLIVILLALTLITPAFAEQFYSKLKMNQPKTVISTYENRKRPSYPHPRYCPQCHQHNRYISRNELGALEQHALNRTYRRESDIARLERLENLAFGATQYGDLRSRYANVENAILSRPQYKTKNSILGNLANYFAGQPTGFTPSLDSYNNFGNYSSNPYSFSTTPSYGNNSFEQYSNGIFGGGWGISGSNFGTGSSVRILD